MEMIPSEERAGYISEEKPGFTSHLTNQSTTHNRLTQPPARVSGLFLMTTLQPGAYGRAN